MSGLNTMELCAVIAECTGRELQMTEETRAPVMKGEEKSTHQQQGQPLSKRRLELEFGTFKLQQSLAESL